jgi:hypothetical protein
MKKNITNSPLSVLCSDIVTEQKEEHRKYIKIYPNNTNEKSI